MARPLKEIDDLSKLRLSATMFADGKDKHGKTHVQSRSNAEFGIHVLSTCSAGKWTTIFQTDETGDRQFTRQEFIDYINSIKQEVTE